MVQIIAIGEYLLRLVLTAAQTPSIHPLGKGGGPATARPIGPGCTLQLIQVLCDVLRLIFLVFADRCPCRVSLRFYIRSDLGREWAFRWRLICTIPAQPRVKWHDSCDLIGLVFVSLVYES